MAPLRLFREASPAADVDGPLRYHGVHANRNQHRRRFGLVLCCVQNKRGILCEV